VEELARMSGQPKAAVLRAVIAAGLTGKIQIGDWTYGPPTQDGRRYKWPPGYFDLRGEDAQPFLDSE
jgi:hypothetical protein